VFWGDRVTLSSALNASPTYLSCCEESLLGFQPIVIERYTSEEIAQDIEDLESPYPAASRRSWRPVLL